MPLSNIYIERPSEQRQAVESLSRVGGLLRVKAPKGMGKRTFLRRVLNLSTGNGLSSIFIDLNSASARVCIDPDSFIRWLCAEMSRQLKLQVRLTEFLDENLGSRLSCTLYLQQYLLPKIDTAIIVAFSGIERMFHEPQMAQSFFPMLRFWHERSKNIAEFAKLRLAIIHAAEASIPIDIHHSPFNVGVSVKLREFDPIQVLEMGKRSGLEHFGQSSANALHSLTSGHPQLCSIAFSEMLTGTQFEDLMASAATQSGAYAELFTSHLQFLNQKPGLSESFHQVLNSPPGMELDLVHANELQSMFLTRLEGNVSQVSCNLYQQFFGRHSFELNKSWRRRVQKLEHENEVLKVMAEIDGLTGVANRRSFDERLQSVWESLTDSSTPISLIMIDIDDFKLYNDMFGHLVGDECLKKVASVIQKCVRRKEDTVARYGGEEFAVILPGMSIYDATTLADNIRLKIFECAIKHNTQPQVVTVSLGVAQACPSSTEKQETLVRKSDKALYRAKDKGRNCVASY